MPERNTVLFCTIPLLRSISFFFFFLSKIPSILLDRLGRFFGERRVFSKQRDTRADRRTTRVLPSFVVYRGQFLVTRDCDFDFSFASSTGEPKARGRESRRRKKNASGRSTPFEKDVERIKTALTYSYTLSSGCCWKRRTKRCVAVAALSALLFFFSFRFAQ